MEEHLKATVSDDDTDDDETDGIGLSQSRASLIQTSFFSSHRGSKSSFSDFIHAFNDLHELCDV